jgi:Cof subfamily protein (haloacid dehalogenase superfamily)
MIAIDIDGTLAGPDGRVSARNHAALKAAEQAGIEIVIATGRRHCYAMRVLRNLALREENALISSNGTVTRTIGAKLLHRTLLPVATARWLCSHVQEFRNAMVMTFDKVRPDGEDTRGALVVEHLDHLNASISKWMKANEPYIAHIDPIERALEDEAPIQMMVCGTVERMRKAEARLLEHPAVSAVGVAPPNHAVKIEVALHRTEYPEKNLSIVDILPAGCSKGAALLQLSADRGVQPGEILAIGDNWNDLSMLEVAGQSILMGNAPDDLKALARERDWTIGSRHDQDGVAEAIEAVLADARVTL